MTEYIYTIKSHGGFKFLIQDRSNEVWIFRLVLGEEIPWGQVKTLSDVEKFILNRINNPMSQKENL